MKLECIDILSDVLKRFGSLLKPEASASCNAALFAQLESTRAATRKRAISCIAALSAALSDKLLGQVPARACVWEGQTLLPWWGWHAHALAPGCVPAP